MKQQGSLKDIVYQAIMNGIFTDEYRPNQIINEQELVEKFGYSKTPIREALVTLCNEGVLKSFPRFGYQVVSLTRDDVSNILDYRFVLEGGFLRESFDRISEANLCELRRLDQKCQENTDSFWDHWEANTNFHMTLISFSGNAYAIQQLERSMNILKRAYAQFYWKIWSNTNPGGDIVHHSNIIDSIAQKNREQALEYLKEDLGDFCS